ncbi:hypothetical protein TWF569_008816 [Orbilia oligospora]|uniref:AB hydrolase-1 domain-containing protein n=1 Tax=Orbilia oligospora TaxID=2813651 RepID=A0A7C8J0G3_ORBOL|nr:hypothetical protein TWF706_001143 [Orbilia oligospora]KAF3085953.1 hypothetical protein TWF102_011210 [Orbilia oligospora]KAF3098774.1 hypothetical protein TWF103_008928 [Orbilia oligospora]KAF3126208.1 hypothetical protein TWF594_001188 [Orbilia oligospora]KAF3138320.1 hypothetical protein TWF569_008816 [Orbilia oligospora]
MEPEATAGSSQSTPTTQNAWKDPVETFTLKDGRTLGYARYGAQTNPKTLPVFYLNGTPGCHLEALLVDQVAERLGIPVISTDRPGFGRSTFHVGGTLLSWPQDIIELADHLDIPKFGVLGLSGGGPYALACVHAIPRERLVAATVVSGIYPVSLGTAGMMWQTRLLLWVASYSTWLVEKLIGMTMGRVTHTEIKDLIKMMEAQAAMLPQPEIDKECMKQIAKDDILIGAYIGSMKEALRPGAKGAAWEFGLFSTDWGFKLEDLDSSRLVIWHGGLDVNVPVGMPDKASSLLPNAPYQRMEVDGHVSVIMRHTEDILSNLISRF